jgi:hypothetical protein
LRAGDRLLNWIHEPVECEVTSVPCGGYDEVSEGHALNLINKIAVYVYVKGGLCLLVQEETDVKSSTVEVGIDLLDGHSRSVAGIFHCCGKGNIVFERIDGGCMGAVICCGRKDRRA